MQDTAHTAGTPTAHQGGLLRDPLKQAPPRSKTRAPAGGAPPRSRGHTSLERAPPRSRAHSPSSGFRLARGYAPPSAGVRHARGRPSHVRRPPVHGHLTPWHRRGGAIMRPGLAPRCRRTNSPGRSPSPPLWGGTVQSGRCQSRDTARLLQYG
jgi:hypothetical protein